MSHQNILPFAGIIRFQIRDCFRNESIRSVVHIEFHVNGDVTEILPIKYN